MRSVLGGLLVFGLGLLAGGYLFSDSQSRSFLAVTSCESRCMRQNELAGLLASTGVLKMPGALPAVVAESDDCIAIRHPKPANRVHLVLFPKRDVRHIADITPEDETFVWGCMAMTGQLIRAEKLENYRVYTNGPGQQHVAYLHFHITGR